MKLFISDLDKTLLNSSHTISLENGRALKKLKEKGYQLIIASGRSFQDVQRIMHTVDLEVPIISLNGAIVVDNKGKIIEKNNITDLDVIYKIIELCEENQYIYHVYTQNTMYSRKYNNMMKELYDLSRSKYNDINSIIDSMQIYYNAFYSNEVINKKQNKKYFSSISDIFKLEIVTTNSTFFKEVEAMLPSSLEATSSSPRNLEIAKKNINKGSAVQTLIDHFKLSRTDVVAIGDNSNDYEMLKLANVSIAMGNATDEIKRISTYITKDYLDDGVAFAIENYI